MAYEFYINTVIKTILKKILIFTISLILYINSKFLNDYLIKLNHIKKVINSK